MDKSRSELGQIIVGVARDPLGLMGLIIVGILSSVMSTIAAYLNSISTLFTFDVYKKWINNEATDRQLVRVGTIATLALMVFAVLYSPVVALLGGIFNYFQMGATYIAVPVATVFLFGIFWKRTTPVAALTVILAGIPICFLTNTIVFTHEITFFGKPVMAGLFSKTLVDQYSLDNFFVQSGFNQILCSILMVVVSLRTKPKPLAEIAPLLWSKKCLFLPEDEPRRPLLQSVGFWWVLFILFYVVIYIIFW